MFSPFYPGPTTEESAAQTVLLELLKRGLLSWSFGYANASEADRVLAWAWHQCNDESIMAQVLEPTDPQVLEAWLRNDYIAEQCASFYGYDYKQSNDPPFVRRYYHVPTVAALAARRSLRR